MNRIAAGAGCGPREDGGVRGLPEPGPSGLMCDPDRNDRGHL